jgi:hypothetical protein
VLSLFVLYYFTKAYIWNLVKNCAVNRANAEDDGVQKFQSNISAPSQPIASSADDAGLSGETPQVRYYAYSMQTV